MRGLSQRHGNRSAGHHGDVDLHQRRTHRRQPQFNAPFRCGHGRDQRAVRLGVPVSASFRCFRHNAQYIVQLLCRNCGPCILLFPQRRSCEACVQRLHLPGDAFGQQCRAGSRALKCLVQSDAHGQSRAHQHRDLGVQRGNRRTAGLQRNRSGQLFCKCTDDERCGCFRI